MDGLRRLALALLVAAIAALAGPAVAEVPIPTVPKAKGERCVEDPDVMRRNHMDFLKHTRDATMRLGVRDSKHALKGCVDCHAVDGPDGKPVTIASPEHFCRSCHSYVGVKPDCFQCHSSVPEAGGDRTAAAK